MNGILRTDLSPEQLLLLEEAFTPWDRAGRWPLWTYIDQRLDAKGLVAADVLASLPTIGSLWGAGSRYELTWYQHSGNRTPNADTPMALTVAGLWHLRPATVPLLMAFKDSLIPGGEERRQREKRGKRGGGVAEFREGRATEHEPYLWHGFWRPDPSADQWK